MLRKCRPILYLKFLLGLESARRLDKISVGALLVREIAVLVRIFAIYTSTSVVNSEQTLCRLRFTLVLGYAGLDALDLSRCETSSSAAMLGSREIGADRTDEGGDGSTG